jgi:S1-C subfamily serine protease
MALMVRSLVIATLLAVLPGAARAQPLSVLHIRIVLIDADGKATPVPRHALLISDNPASSAPRRVVTSLDGTADVRLAPGNYTVESDRPVALKGKAYQWTQIIDIAAGRDAVLELTAGNAENAPAGSAAAADAAPPEAADPSAEILTNWHDSVVAVWTPAVRASGFVIDAKGLIATNQRVVGNATSVEVQFTPAVKVAARVVAADAAKDVAILQVNPGALASIRPIVLACGQPVKPFVANQKIFTIGNPLGEERDLVSGSVNRVDQHGAVSDFRLDVDNTGGPVFVADGSLVGITSFMDEKDRSRRDDSRLVRIDEACSVVASAEKRLKDAAPPSGAALPVEPAQAFPVEALKEAVKRRTGSLNPYQIATSDFDVAFITPVLVYGTQDRAERSGGRGQSGITRGADGEPTFVRDPTDYGSWSEYVAKVPPVLLIRVTPRQVESFWTTVARGAAQTQGVALPPIKHFKGSFSKMRVVCGDAEITPIHTFTIEQRISETDAINEGLFVFDPGAIGPPCGTVKLVIYSEKAPDKGDTRVVDPKVLQQIWQDFSPYRALK